MDLLLDRPISSLSIPPGLNGCPIEQLVSQIQPFTSKYLLVKNSTHLLVYNTLDDVLPGHRQLEPHLSRPSNEYYIRDLQTHDVLCCFDLRLCERLLLKKPRDLLSRSDLPDYSVRTSGRGRSLSSSPYESRLTNKVIPTKPIFRPTISGERVINIISPIEKAHVIVSLEHLN